MRPSSLLQLLAMSVVVVASLLVSSGSKIALFGSTVTEFVIVPSVAGATTRMSTVWVDAGPTAPPLQSMTFELFTVQVSPGMLDW